MNHFAIKPLGVIMLMAVFTLSSAHATVSSSDSRGKPHAAKVKKKSAQGGQVKFLPGSAETPGARSARLKRECKGRVNAGACAGYTG